ncbi:sensor histidine kinase [Actinospica sp. MGRD01-02]|uniref:histidine kinase n=1 Tax=Actinospica acidithermotolerans TaxID=2828514 RepID=A0A941E805_9ACTN|nr:sensor histidine kinase [Actinospica acidithermotolerans]MBR7826761.1 sensor histidine kinase [Actinospica acidithermotolerans]
MLFTRSTADSAHLTTAPVLTATLAFLAGFAVAAYAAWLRGRRIRARYEAELDEATRLRPNGDPRESARRAFVNLARRIQALVDQQLRELRDMESRHGADADVFGDLLHVDHGTALIGRLADSLAVLGGERPERRWPRPIPVLGVLRGAMARITEYPRVDIGRLPEHSVVDGACAEPLIHALAELLDNATRYSPPEARVEVSAYEVPNGLVIDVLDAGIGMGPNTLGRADLALRTETIGFELSALGETPQLGLAVVGKLARAAGFEVTLQRAGDVGIRASIRVPEVLLRGAPDPRPEVRSAPEAGQPAPARPRPAHRGPRSAEPAEVTGQGLPRRRRYDPAAEVVEP